MATLTGRRETFLYSGRSKLQIFIFVKVLPRRDFFIEIERKDELNDEITWEAKHLGIRQKLTVKITRMEAPFLFEDTMLKGAFKSMKHQHQFEEKEGRTYMFDVFRYQVPFGLIGLLFDLLVLKRYMRKFLEARNNFLKSVAEET